MAENKNIFDETGALISRVQEYLKLRLELFRLEVTDRFVRLVSDLVTAAFMVTIGLFVLLFLSFAFAYWFGESTGKWPLAFLMTAAFWMLLGLIVFIFRKPLILDQVTRFTGRQIELDHGEDEDKMDDDEL